MYVNCAIRVPFPAASTAIVLNFAQWLRRKVTMHRTRLKWVATSGQRTTDYLCVLFIVLLLSPASLCHHHPHHRHRQSQHSQPSTSNLHEFQSAFGDQQSIQWATWQQQHQQQSLLPGDQLGSHEVHYPSRPVALAQTKCVERCSCKWRSGKMWVECMEVGLHSVPRGLDSGTQVLYLTGNPLQELEARIFDRNNLRNLQRLYLSSCHLHTINSDAFLQLSNLIELDLAHNELTNLPTNSLVHCPILRKLTLAKNQIRAIKNSAFQTLIHLQSIDLSGNGIELIDSNAFYGLKSLKQLYLHENKLRFLESQTMQSLPSVYELTLQHNPWKCDCSLRSFRIWMVERGIPLSYSPNCTTPARLQGKTWSQLDMEEFACSPDVVSVDTEVVVYEGENASIGCVMAAIPNVHIEWEWRGRTIRNMSLMTFGRQMYLIRESHSPAGVTMSILPMDEAIAAAAAEAVAAAAAANQTDVNASDEDDLRDQQSLKASRFIQKRSVISHQSHHRKPRHTLSDDETYKRTSTLYIMNALEKDSGSYICTGSNKAGSVSANITLTVLRRLEVTAAAYSGEEVAGIVLGALFVFLLTFVAICFVVLKSKNSLRSRNTCATSGLNGGIQPVLTETTTTQPTNGIIPNGHVRQANGGSTIQRQHSILSTETGDSKTHLYVSLNGSIGGKLDHPEITIRTNHLAEQIELNPYFETAKSLDNRTQPDIAHNDTPGVGQFGKLPTAAEYGVPLMSGPLGSSVALTTGQQQQQQPATANFALNRQFAHYAHHVNNTNSHYSFVTDAESAAAASQLTHNGIGGTIPLLNQAPPAPLSSGDYGRLDHVYQMPLDGQLPKVDLNIVDEVNRRRAAAASMAEEFQLRLAEAAKRGSIDSSSTSGSQVVRFANSHTVYSYPVSGPGNPKPLPPQQQQNPALNRIRSGANPSLVRIVARDSPDEGLGEESID